MARRTFISYKYSESIDLRDKIIRKLGKDAQFYRGENGYSEDLSNHSSNMIKKYLSDMIYQTSVAIVILSPNMLQSNWMEWEIQYALSNYSRDGRTSKTNGIVAVIQNEYNWSSSTYNSTWIYDCYGNIRRDKLFQIIKSNMNNNTEQYFKTLSKDYISIVSESTFLSNPNKYIEEAYEKSQNLDKYCITKQIKNNGGWF